MHTDTYIYESYTHTIYLPPGRIPRVAIYLPCLRVVDLTHNQFEGHTRMNELPMLHENKYLIVYVQYVYTHMHK